MELNVASIFFRWLHVMTACVLVGSVFFFRVLLPRGTRDLDPAARETVALRCRRGFKMTVHVSLLFILISGIYNTTRNWHVYTQNPGVMHGLFGMHGLLGLGGITILMIVLAGREPRKSQGPLTQWALIALVLAVAVASTLKSAREYAAAHPELAKHRPAAAASH